MDELTLLAGREENPSPARITAAARQATNSFHEHGFLCLGCPAFSARPDAARRSRAFPSCS
jgi:hypothetical protein